MIVICRGNTKRKREGIEIKKSTKYNVIDY